MGQKKDTTTEEENFENNIKTAGDMGEDNPQPISSAHTEPTQPNKASKMISLESIFSSILAGEKEWPMEFFASVKKRFGRMPRGGWTRGAEYFRGKFASNLSDSGFKKVAANASKNNETMNSEEEKTKRRKKEDGLPDESGLSDARLYNNLRDLLSSKMKSSKGKSVESAERTRKIPFEKVNHQVIGILNTVVGAYVNAYPMSNMTDLARILQAVQACYQETTSKSRAPSSWKSNIEKKIGKLQSSIELIDKKIGIDRMTTEETKAARKVMRQFNLVLDKPCDRTEAKAKLCESIRIYNKKLEMHEKRKLFRRQNQCFELYRRKFYRDLSLEVATSNSVSSDNIKEYWSTMWSKKADTPQDFDNYLVEYLPEEITTDNFPTMREFENILKFLPCWKAAGVDGVFNFFIKRMTSLHEYLYSVIKEICLDGKCQDDWFYRGITYLIPKGTPTKGSDYRPITCMSNLYKLTTKCVTEVMQLEVERRGLLAENQLGTVRRVQGAKEQALLNIAINKEYGNKLKVTWIDVKKAFDSVEHTYLLKCIKKLNFPAWIQTFLCSIVSRWNLEVRAGSEVILDKRVERGILQGDSLSPLLFVLCMDPLSRKLNMSYPMVAVHCNEISHSTNHLLFIDDLKLLATSGDNLKAMVEESKKFFKTIGLEVNAAKSATNEESCADTGALLDGLGVYKYLGIIEDSTGQPTRLSFVKVKDEMLARVERLCSSKLNAKNLFKAINEHAISLVNYHIGLQHLEPADFADLDHSIRKVLVKHSVHLQPGCKERLYLPRTELGRGLHNVEMRSECMLLQLKELLDKHKLVSTRRATILKVEENNKTHLALIRPYVEIKYGITSPCKESLELAQKERLYNEIKKKIIHSKLYMAKENSLVNIKDSSTWLKSGNIRPRDEATFCYIQDRNVFWGETSMCQHCGKAKKTVDHLATRCDRMLGHDYTRRHNEVLRCLHLLLANKYGFKKSKKIRGHSVQEVMENERAEIKVDTRIRTDIKISNNRPDIFIYDKGKQEIILIEVGITSQDNLQQVELEKTKKYDILANELKMLYKCKSTRIIPYVMTWDGIVTNYHYKYIKQLEVTPTIEAYIQSIVLKKTLETISFEHRRGIEDGLEREEVIQQAIVRMREACNAKETADE